MSDSEFDLRPGGAVNTTMRGPDGTEMPNVGCFLEVVPLKKLAFTDALQPGYRPAKQPFITVVLTLTPEGNGTRYNATVLHADEADRQKHEAMGFAQGWSTALDQLVEHAKTM